MKKSQILLCLLLFSLAAFAQTDRGTITGTVSDATGAVIPGATIEADKLLVALRSKNSCPKLGGEFVLANLLTATIQSAVNLGGYHHEISRVLHLRLFNHHFANRICTDRSRHAHRHRL